MSDTPPPVEQLEVDPEAVHIEATLLEVELELAMPDASASGMVLPAPETVRGSRLSLLVGALVLGLGVLYALKGTEQTRLTLLLVPFAAYAAVGMVRAAQRGSQREKLDT